MKKGIFPIAIVLFLLIGCDSSKEKSNTESTTGVESPIQNNASSGIDASVKTPPAGDSTRLNTIPAANNSPIPSSQPTMPGAAPAPQPTVTAAGMNPPHGEPGHDCGIPVGSPLKK